MKCKVKRICGLALLDELIAFANFDILAVKAYPTYSFFIAKQWVAVQNDLASLALKLRLISCVLAKTCVVSKVGGDSGQISIV